MVEMIAKVIVNQMEEEKILSGKIKEHYEYALIGILEKGITIFSILCLSIVLECIVPMGIFLAFFLTLRKRTGGYHTDAFWKCYFGTLAISTMITIICPIALDNMNIIYALLVLSILSIALIGTVNHPNMLMDSSELQESKRAARYLLGLECMILYSAIILDLHILYIYYMAMAIILCASLLCVAKILKQEVE